jgi:hypothetical protein
MTSGQSTGHHSSPGGRDYETLDTLYLTPLVSPPVQKRLPGLIKVAALGQWSSLAWQVRCQRDTVHAWPPGPPPAAVTAPSLRPEVRAARTRARGREQNGDASPGSGPGAAALPG